MPSGRGEPEERSEGRAEQDAPAEAFHAPPGHEEAARDDAAVVDERCERGGQELLADIEQGGHARAGQEEDLCGQDDAQEMGQPGLFFRGKSRPDDPGEFRSEDPCHGGQGGYAEGRPPEHSREEPPAVCLVLLEPLGKQRDQRDRNITAREQVIEEVGDHEGREIDVRFRPRPELPRNHLIPYQPHEPGQEHAARHDQGRYAHFMRCRQSHCLSLMIGGSNRVGAFWRMHFCLPCTRSPPPTVFWE